MWMCADYCKTRASLQGKTVVVTGATGAIGQEIVRDFYHRGARVILAYRNLELVQKIITDIVENNNNKLKGELVIEYLDLSSLESVKKCATNILKNESEINLLINNAGIFLSKEKFTKDGFESNFAVNYLGHFLFTLLLLPKIIESKPARIVNVSSISFVAISSIDFDDFNYEKPSNPYSDLLSYGQKKGIQDVTTYSLHPGHTNTGITRNLKQISNLSYLIYNTIVAPVFLKTPKQGAQTVIHCAVDENVKNESGFFYRNCKKANLTKFATNEALDEELWKRSILILQNFFGDKFTIPDILKE